MGSQVYIAWITNMRDKSLGVRWLVMQQVEYSRTSYGCSTAPDLSLLVVTPKKQLLTALSLVKARPH